MENSPLQILMGTKAQANLFKMGIMPHQLWEMERNPVRLVAANNTFLAGGDQTMNFCLCFEVEEYGKTLLEPLNISAEFYSAKIEVGAILSYPWLRENGVGVFPHHNAFAKDFPTFALLHGSRRT